MSKSQQSSVFNQAGGQINANNAGETANNTELQGIMGNATNTANSVLPGVVSGYSDIASTGGYDPSVLGNINSTYSNLMSGGLSPTQVTAMENQASQAAQSTYQTGQAQAQRAQAATGGYGVSGSIAGSLAQQGSQAASQATTNEIASIAQLQSQNEATGAAGASTVQQNLTGNKLAATGGLTNIYGMSENQITQTMSQILQNYQQTGQLNNQDLAIMTNLADQPGVLQQIMSMLGASGQSAGGVMQGVGQMQQSDERVKDDINEIGEINGIPIVTFRYKGSSEYKVGTLAQRVEEKYPEAVTEKKIKYVDYSQLEKSIIGDLVA